MNKKRIALALAVGLSLNALVVTVAPIGGQSQIAHAQEVNITDLGGYLKNVYIQVFDRDPDEEGYRFYLDKLSSKEMSLREFLLSLLSSTEFNMGYKTPGAKIRGLYTAIVTRPLNEEEENFWIVNKYDSAVKQFKSEEVALKKVVDEIINESKVKELAEKLNVKW